jgi:hypothetical protein
MTGLSDRLGCIPGDRRPDRAAVQTDCLSRMATNSVPVRVLGCARRSVIMHVDPGYRFPAICLQAFAENLGRLDTAICFVD